MRSFPTLHSALAFCMCMREQVDERPWRAVLKHSSWLLVGEMWTLFKLAACRSRRTMSPESQGAQHIPSN